MKQDTVDQTVKALPAGVGLIWGTVTLNDLVLGATLIYVVLQAAFLGYKWYWDYQDRKNDEHS